MMYKQRLEKPLQLIQMTLAVLWIYQGVIPKILFQSKAEINIWQTMGFELDMAKICVALSGLIKIMFGCTLSDLAKNSLAPSAQYFGLNWIIIPDNDHRSIPTHHGI